MTPAEAELESLYYAHRRSVLSAATLAAGGSTHAGWDGVQHAFEQAWISLTDPSRPEVRDWRGWLRKAAVRHVVQTAQRDARDLPLKDLDRQDDGPLLENRVALKREYQGILEAIAVLPVRQRQALALVCIAGHSTKDTAVIMDIEIPTVRSLVSQARRALPENYGEEGCDEQ